MTNAISLDNQYAAIFNWGMEMKPELVETKEERRKRMQREAYLKRMAGRGDELRARRREIYWANPDKARNKAKRHYVRNREQIRVRDNEKLIRMRIEQPEKFIEYSRRYYEKHKEFLLETEKAKRQQVRLYLVEYKLNLGCADCGFKGHPAALDFDHITGDKKYLISRMRSLELAKEEIKKCEVVCANCHRIRTWKRQHGKIKDDSILDANDSNNVYMQ